jgi:colanic acid/amylovoran biosynthesis glycosyltransferase
MRLAVIASMKSGLEHFVHREMCELSRRGIAISLLPTKHGPGLYSPRPEWNVCTWRAWRVAASQPWRLVQMPLRYLAVLMTAIRYRAVVEFFLAAYFAPRIGDADALYATFGDRKLFVAYFCKRLMCKPLSVTIHAYELYVNPNPGLFAIALAACDQIMTVTEYNRELLRDRYGVAPERVQVVRLSVDLDEYRPAEKFVVLIVAFFVEKKGHEVLFEAVKKMGRDDVEVWVVGGSGGASCEVDVPAIAGRLGMESQVALFGKLSGTALKAVYHACDVFCLPSRFDRHGEAEGFPTVLIEAMACGKPVVTTRHVEIPRIVEQVLVEENDVDALAAALESVYASAALRHQLGKRSRELAELHFSSRNVDQKVEMFERLAEVGKEHGAKSETPDAVPTTLCSMLPAPRSLPPVPRSRVLMLLENCPYSEDGRVRREATALMAAGYSVTVICPRGRGEPRFKNYDGLLAYQYTPRSLGSGLLGYVVEYGNAMIATLLLSVYACIRRGFDVVHAHNPPDFFIVIALLYKLLGKQFVFDHHDLTPDMYQARFSGRQSGLVYRVLCFFERWSCRLADQVITTSQSYKQVEIERSGIDPHRITIVRNGPEPMHFRQVAPHADLKSPDKTVIGYVGEMGPLDGIDNLLRALKSLCYELHRDDWTCVLVGDGEVRLQLEKLARELGVGDHVQFVGRTTHAGVVPYLRAMDIGTIPDPKNPYNDRCTMIKTMEYMAQCVPIVSSDLRETRYSAGEAAIYVDPTDPCQFAHAIERLMDDPDLRRRMGEAGRNRAESVLAWNHSVPSLLGVYERLSRAPVSGAVGTPPRQSAENRPLAS